jgi:hypothetical protein
MQDVDDTRRISKLVHVNMRVWFSTEIPGTLCGLRPRGMSCSVELRITAASIALPKAAAGKLPTAGHSEPTRGGIRGTNPGITATFAAPIKSSLLKRAAIPQTDSGGRKRGTPHVSMQTIFCGVSILLPWATFEASEFLARYRGQWMRGFQQNTEMGHEDKQPPLWIARCDVSSPR